MLSIGLIIHIPHASLYIPDEYKQDYLLPPDALNHEAYWAADLYCDEIYDIGYGTPVIAQRSRLVCDVERFRDDAQEPCALKGNGLYYTHTLGGEALRPHNPLRREKVLSEIYDPHHAQLTATVDGALGAHDTCLIIDGHSFGDEIIYGENLPDFCIGTDAYHTPGWMADKAYGLLRSMGYTVELNRPFAGAITPMKHYQQDKRVMALMIEVNKRLYMDEKTFEKTEGFEKVKSACHKVISEICEYKIPNKT